ncbi:MAG: hypothetical protein HYX67_00945 [Candidatus Melainabacteria bacterium]|nr:hypothetical protein [Candidatus Melainabacteria bacterium]
MRILGDGNIPIEIGVPPPYIEHVPSADPITLFDSAINANQSAPAKPSEALELLRRDIAAHTDQMAHKSYLGSTVSALASLGRGNTLQPVEQLNDQLDEAVKKGDTATANKLAAQAKSVVDADKAAMHTDQLITQYGAGMVKTAGLFIPNRVGYAISGIAYALDQAKPGDSISDQLIDGGLGAAKGLGIKGSFTYLGSKDMGIAMKAVSLGISARVMDSALTRETYADGHGGYSATAGLAKTVDQSFNRTALASDVITFGLAHGALSGINGITSGALRNSPFWSTVATGGVFGASAGSVQEINRQQQSGEKFDIQKIITSAALTGATDMIAAGPGARMASGRAFADRQEIVTDRSSEKTESPKINPVLQRNFPESHSREFQLVNSDQQVIEQLRSNPKGFVLAPVQEVTASGVLGPPGNMILQHLEPFQDSASRRAIAKTASIGSADWLATCNPEQLPESLRAKHIMPTAEGVFVTQDTTGRLRFTDTAPVSLQPGESQPLKLDNTISELLLSPRTPKYIENTHDKTAIAQAMRHFKTPVRYFNSGVDNIAFELPDRSILKITDHGWDPSWGAREFWTPEGVRPFDGLILRKPQTIELRDTSVTYFVQKRLMTPVTTAEVRNFDRMMKEDGVYEFWDNDFKTHGAKQLGIDPDDHKVYLIDYDAVRYPHLVPKFEPETQEALVDRILERYND